MSVAANVASVVGRHGLDPLAIAVSGWPRIALLVVVEIMARPGKPKPQTKTGHAAADEPGQSSRPTEPPPSLDTQPRPLFLDEGTIAPAEIAKLLPIAHAARDAVIGQGRAVTRDALAAQFRSDGYPMRNARVSMLLHALREDNEADDPDESEEREAMIG